MVPCLRCISALRFMTAHGMAAVSSTVIPCAEQVRHNPVI